MRHVVMSVYGHISLIVWSLLCIFDVSVFKCLSCESCCVIVAHSIIMSVYCGIVCVSACIVTVTAMSLSRCLHVSNSSVLVGLILSLLMV